MRCNFDLLGNINDIVKFCSASDIMHERRLAPHDDYHLSSYYYVCMCFLPAARSPVFSAMFEHSMEESIKVHICNVYCW